MSAPTFWTAAKAERISAARSFAQERQPRALTNKKQKVLIENDFNMQRYYDYFLEMDLRSHSSQEISDFFWYSYVSAHW